MFNNLIANLISNIRVAIQHKRQSGSSHYSKFALTILNKLQEKNIVGKITIENKKNRKYICFDLPNYNYTYFISEILEHTNLVHSIILDIEIYQSYCRNILRD